MMMMMMIVISVLLMMIMIQSMMNDNTGLQSDTYLQVSTMYTFLDY
jgi:hypothetical protein